MVLLVIVVHEWNSLSGMLKTSLTCWVDNNKPKWVAWPALVIKKPPDCIQLLPFVQNMN